MKNLWSTIQSGKIWRGELKNKAKDGSLYWVFTTIIPTFDIYQNPKQYISIRYEITEMKNAEEEKKKMEYQLNVLKSNQEVSGRFISALTHI